MPATERYQVDFFAILVLIVAVLIIVFLIITAIYFYHLMNLRPPTRGESTFLFWTSIILSVIFLGLAIYALVHIFTHTATVYEEPPVVRNTTVTTAPLPIPITVSPSVITQPPVITRSPPVVTRSSPVRISNVTRTAPVSDYSVDYSDIPVTRQQRTALNQELLSIGSAMDE